ncbi:MAG: hypothetical protein LC109_07840 [Bacteroidia bacterium]|nr:hypothetical protein [Bacteroidia bacterium]
MKNTITTLSMFCFAMLISCCKDDTTPNGNKPGTASYMEATINGETWKACRTAGAVGQIQLGATYYPNDGYLQLYGVDYCRVYNNSVSTAIAFRLHSMYDIGYYLLSEKDFGSFKAFTSFGNFQTNDTTTGWLRVTEINTKDKYISGEFEFSGYNGIHDSTISDIAGKFNRIPY